MFSQSSCKCSILCGGKINVFVVSSVVTSCYGNRDKLSQNICRVWDVDDDEAGFTLPSKHGIVGQHIFFQHRSRRGAINNDNDNGNGNDNDNDIFNQGTQLAKVVFSGALKKDKGEKHLLILS